MVYPSVFFIHSATIRHATGYIEDPYGNRVPTTTDTVVSCRFVGADETNQVGGTVIGVIESIPRAVFPPGTVIEDNDKVISTVDGFVGTYNVMPRKVIYEAVVEQVSHIICGLTAVV